MNRKEIGLSLSFADFTIAVPVEFIPQNSLHGIFYFIIPKSCAEGFRKLHLKSGEMVRWVKCLPHKCKDWSSDPQNSRGSWTDMVATYDPNTGEVEAETSPEQVGWLD